MRQYPRRNARLQDRDYEILLHVMRYRLTTPEVLHRQEYFVDVERNAVTKVTTRLCDDDYLQCHPLYGSNVYFTLGRNGARAVGLAARRVGPLGPQALYREFGTLAFCWLGPTRRERLRVRELAKDFPDLVVKRLDCSHYYFDDHNSVRRLGFIWTEGGGSPQHIAEVVYRDILERRRQTVSLRTWIDSDQFVVAIVTYSQEKREAIHETLLKIPKHAVIRVEVVPELINLLPGA